MAAMFERAEPAAPGTDTCLAILAFYALALSIPGLQPPEEEDKEWLPVLRVLLKH